MTFLQNLKQSLKSPSLPKNMLLGAGIGLTLISVFLIMADKSDPGWHRFWMIRPLLIVPLAGSMGGLFYTITEPWRRQGGWKKIMLIIVCLLVYLIALWIGTVLGLEGTYWD